MTPTPTEPTLVATLIGELEAELDAIFETGYAYMMLEVVHVNEHCEYHVSTAVMEAEITKGAGRIPEREFAKTCSTLMRWIARLLRTYVIACTNDAADDSIGCKIVQGFLWTHRIEIYQCLFVAQHWANNRTFCGLRCDRRMEISAMTRHMLKLRTTVFIDIEDAQKDHL